MKAIVKSSQNVQQLDILTISLELTGYQVALVNNPQLVQLIDAQIHFLKSLQNHPNPLTKDCRMIFYHTDLPLTIFKALVEKYGATKPRSSLNYLTSYINIDTEGRHYISFESERIQITI